MHLHGIDDRQSRLPRRFRRSTSGPTARLAIAYAAIAIVVTVLAGCASASGKTSVGRAAPAPTGAPGFGSAPPASASASSASSGSTGGAGGGGQPTTYPSTDKDYTRAVLDAYDAGAKTRIADLSAAGDADEFNHLGNPDRHWHFHNCGDDGARRMCTYDNNNGDRITVDVDPSVLGKPHAVTGVFIDRTVYSKSADGVVGAFMQAWFDGDTYRMTALADSTATKYATSSSDTPESWTLSDEAGQAGHTIVHVQTNINGLVFDVTLSRLGHPHAFTEAIS